MLIAFPFSFSSHIFAAVSTHCNSLLDAYADRLPEHRLVHDAEAILSGLLRFALLRVRVSQDKQVEFLRDRISDDQACLCGEFLGKLALNQLSVPPALKFAGET